MTWAGENLDTLPSPLDQHVRCNRCSGCPYCGQAWPQPEDSSSTAEWLSFGAEEEEGEADLCPTVARRSTDFVNTEPRSDAKGEARVEHRDHSGHRVDQRRNALVSGTRSPVGNDDDVTLPIGYRARQWRC